MTVFDFIKSVYKGNEGARLYFYKLDRKETTKNKNKQKNNQFLYFEQILLRKGDSSCNSVEAEPDSF